ncbi:MAG: DUF2256 domain-containing protein [Phycisphaeraceae bacterium]|nr:DUF2256 domain-containing protein [Phycisphaeraceae bacterium]MCW5768599.1 DUF2256 domain-containing protein [Phycisphaeraceae bacterium]
MPRRTHDTPRPEKVCPVCARPFQWRKKWERDWDRVIYCSDRCRRSGRGITPRLTPRY